jgi:hypothetical protein
MNQDNRTQNEKQKEFDTHIFRLLELIENIPDIKDGQYKESCDIFMELRKMFQQTKQQIIQTTIFTTMTRRAVRSVNNPRYLSELEKVYDDDYERCQKCSSMVKISYMKQHLKSKKCCMNHEAKYQSIKIGEIKDERIANRMIYASTFTFNLKKGNLVSDIDSLCRYKIFPHLLENELTPEERRTENRRLTISNAYLECNSKYANNTEYIDWYKDENGKWCENGKHN